MKKIVLISASLALLGLTTPSSVSAQTTLPFQLTNSTATYPADFEMRADGTFLAKLNYFYSYPPLTSSVTAADLTDRVFLWSPIQGALRVGFNVSGSWTPSNLATDSFAFGAETTASGIGAVALGDSSTATGSGAVAIGDATATNNDSIAIGGGLSTGVQSVAFGLSRASGNDSTSLSYETQALSYCSTAVGCFNVGIGLSGTANATTWVSTDPLFEVGNGTGSAPSDALVVYKNGSVDAQGPITAAPGGDIPMYTGN